jgi:hypothetical protein
MILGLDTTASRMPWSVSVASTVSKSSVARLPCASTSGSGLRQPCKLPNRFPANGDPPHQLRGCIAQARSVAVLFQA